MAINNDPLGILSSLRGITKGPVQPSPRQQALIDRLAAIGGGMTRKGNGWEVWGASDRGWANNLNGVEDTISDFERYFWGNNYEGMKAPIRVTEYMGPSDVYDLEEFITAQTIDGSGQPLTTEEGTMAQSEIDQLRSLAVGASMPLGEPEAGLTVERLQSR